MEKVFKTVNRKKIPFSIDRVLNYVPIKKVKIRNGKTNINNFLNLVSNIHLPVFCFSERWLGAYEDTIKMKKNLQHFKTYNE